jgi:hypothetical protein
LNLNSNLNWGVSTAGYRYRTPAVTAVTAVYRAVPSGKKTLGWWRPVVCGWVASGGDGGGGERGRAAIVTWFTCGLERVRRGIWCGEREGRSEVNLSGTHQN